MEYYISDAVACQDLDGYQARYFVLMPMLAAFLSTARPFASAQVHQRLVYRAMGNGKSFTDNESFTEFANPETGVSRFVGTTINIQVPHYGNLLVDAGTLTIDFTTDPWTVLHEGGPHPFYHGGYGPLCDYLAS